MEYLLIIETLRKQGVSEEDLVEIRQYYDCVVEEDEKLIVESKPYHDLLIPVEGIVTSVEGRTFKTKKWEICDCCGEEMAISGEESQLEITLKTKLPVKELIFKGYSPVKNGDKIRAYVYGGDEMELKTKELVVRVPRPMFEVEQAEYIEMISKVGKRKVLRTDYSRDFIGREELEE